MNRRALALEDMSWSWSERVGIRVGFCVMRREGSCRTLLIGDAGLDKRDHTSVEELVADRTKRKLN